MGSSLQWHPAILFFVGENDLKVLKNAIYDDFMSLPVVKIIF